MIITLAPEYLDTLKAGKHTLTVSFDDGDDASAEFTIKEKTPAGGNEQGGNGGESGGPVKTGDDSRAASGRSPRCCPRDSSQGS